MNLTMRYKAPAMDSAEGWERESLPIGCGWLGANVFGIPGRERVQITENSMVNTYQTGGLNNLAELYFEFPTADVTGYERGLSLDDAVAYTKYEANGVEYTREYFASYPDRCLVMRFACDRDKSLKFTAAPEIPYIKDYCNEPGDGFGKSGEICKTDDGRLILSGRMEYHNVRYEAQLKIITDGEQEISDDRIVVKNAKEAVVIFACGTNYVLSETAFLEDDPKKKIPDVSPHAMVSALLDAAAAKGYDALRERHLADYRALFGRVTLELGGECGYTDEMLEAYRNGAPQPYLEALYFQYGRYLLIASSRPGTLPANLQGVWNVHDKSPWGSGYWHNINVQMNYWPAFPCALDETFEAYIHFNEAFRKKAMEGARGFIRDHLPENLDSDNLGWIIGTAAFPYMISRPGGHSGPGTGGLTTKLFAEMYNFTKDKRALAAHIYPAIAGMSRFLTRTVREYDGELLAEFSASPEQFWRDRIYYQTHGCAFDQQMIWENGADLLRLAEELGIDDETVQKQRGQIDRYAPVHVGCSGQIKEYREENYYGEVGEYCHRHISQLVGLYPGTLINHNTPAWLDAAVITLNERGDHSTGWALAHRLNARARTGDGEASYRLLHNLLGERTLPNLWDFHPPFQIDGNFGGTSGICEMLLQSHEGYIAPLPALPKAWAHGQFDGLRARGGFAVSASWDDGRLTKLTVKSLCGEPLEIVYPGIADAAADREKVQISQDRVSVKLDKGESVTFADFPEPVMHAAVESLVAVYDGAAKLSWKCKENVNIYRAVDDDPDYTPVAQNVSGGEYTDEIDLDAHNHVTYKVTAGGKYELAVLSTRPRLTHVPLNAPKD